LGQNELYAKQQLIVRKKEEWNNFQKFIVSDWRLLKNF
jgi:hypothetical protein